MVPLLGPDKISKASLFCGIEANKSKPTKLISWTPSSCMEILSSSAVGTINLSLQSSSRPFTNVAMDIPDWENPSLALYNKKSTDCSGGEYS